MPFSPETKRNVRQKAHNRCCYCHELHIEVHHIIPESEGGPDTFENAAPLCSQCHEIFGHNPQMQNRIRESRDAWYDICEKRFAPIGGYDKIDELAKSMEQAATKDDIQRVMQEIRALQDHFINQSDQSPQEIVQVISDISTSVSSEITVEPMYQCKSCGKLMERSFWNTGVCPYCKSPLF